MPLEIIHVIFLAVGGLIGVVYGRKSAPAPAPVPTVPGAPPAPPAVSLAGASSHPVASMFLQQLEQQGIAFFESALQGVAQTALQSMLTGATAPTPAVPATKVVAPVPPTKA